MNTKLVLNYSNLLCQKIELHADAFLQRIDALCICDTERVEFIENMLLEPLEKQQNYLWDRLEILAEKENKNDHK